MNYSIITQISVCIPTYNCAEYLRQAVDSVLLQSYQNLEIVIVDNCSTDETVTLVEEIISSSSRDIQFYKNDRNIGMVSNLNRCLELARGAYIKFLMADDILLPGCLEEMAIGLDTNKDISLVACGRLIIDELGSEQAINRYSKKNVVIPGKQVPLFPSQGSRFHGGEIQ